jgi:hypothetical protein
MIRKYAPLATSTLAMPLPHQMIPATNGLDCLGLADITQELSTPKNAWLDCLARTLIVMAFRCVAGGIVVPLTLATIDTMPPKKTKKPQKALKAPKLSEDFISRVNNAPSWPAVIEVVRHQYGLPNLSTKGGLKECYRNFNVVSKNLTYVW